MRVVSLTCSNTEIVCALGCSHMLVGVDRHSDHPVEVVRELPRVGPDLGIDVDAVAALKPDLVLASLTVPGHEAVVEGIRAAGLPCLAPEPVSLEDVYADIRLIGGRLGVPERAEGVVDSMRQEAVASAVGGDRPKILVEWWPRPVIVPGRFSWVTDLITLAGGENPMGTRGVKSSPVTDDEVVAMAPDVVVVSWCGVPDHKLQPERVMRRSAWVDVPAVRNRRVVAVPEAFLGRPGPRLVEGLKVFRALVSEVRGSSR